MLIVDVGVTLGDVAAVVHHEVVETTAAMAEATPLVSPRTSFPHVNSAAKLIIQCSSAISALIQTTWEKREVQMRQIHMVLIQTGTQTLGR
jgi:hypothetical protein